MLKYILKRVLFFIPTMIVITLIGFVIAINAPGDPVERMMTSAQSGGEIGTNSISQEENKMFWRKKLGLDLPVFYFSLSKYSYSDTLYRIYDKQEQEALARLIDEYGNWDDISSYYLALCKLQSALSAFKPGNIELEGYDKNIVNENFNTIRFEAVSLRSTYSEKIIATKITNMRKLMADYPFFIGFKEDLRRVEDLFGKIKSNKSVWKNYVPAVYFYGKNQYHRWLFGDGETTRGLLRFDLGISYKTKDSIGKTLTDRLPWSLFFSLFSVLISYSISIPLGVRAARKRGSRFDKISSVILYALYSMPGFFVALLLMQFFASPDFLDLLPAQGVKPAEGYPDDAGFFEKCWLSLPYMILPLIAYSYSSFAYLSRTMRTSMLEVINQDFIRTAHAKGLPEKKVIWKHAFRNSLLPLITIFANVFPASIGGSVIMETIFTIPGMGHTFFESISGNDYPMIIAVLTISAILTLIGYLVSDILYAVADPRIQYN